MASTNTHYPNMTAAIAAVNERIKEWGWKSPKIVTEPLWWRRTQNPRRTGKEGREYEEWGSEFIYYDGVERIPVPDNVFGISVRFYDPAERDPDDCDSQYIEIQCCRGGGDDMFDLPNIHTCVVVDHLVTNPFRVELFPENGLLLRVPPEYMPRPIREWEENIRYQAICDALKVTSLDRKTVTEALKRSGEVA